MERETRIDPESHVPLEEAGLYDGEVLRFPVEDGDDQGALEQALIASAYILRYIGGAVTFAAIRREIRPGSGAYITTEIVMRWNSFVPPVKVPGNGTPRVTEQEPAAATG